MKPTEGLFHVAFSFRYGGKLIASPTDSPAIPLSRRRNSVEFHKIEVCEGLACNLIFLFDITVPTITPSGIDFSADLCYVISTTIPRRHPMDETVKAYLERYPDEIKTLFEKMRDIILNLVPVSLFPDLKRVSLERMSVISST